MQKHAKNNETRSFSEQKHEVWSEKCCTACRGPHQHPAFILVLKFYHTLFWYHKCWFWFVSNWAARILCLRLSSRFRNSGLTLHIYSLHSLHRTMTMTPRHHETQKHENIGYRYPFPSLNPKQVKWDNTTLCTTHPAQYMHKYITCTNMPVNIYTHRTRTLGVIHAQIHNVCSRLRKGHSLQALVEILRKSNKSFHARSKLWWSRPQRQHLKAGWQDHLPSRAYIQKPKRQCWKANWTCHLPQTPVEILTNRQSWKTTWQCHSQHQNIKMWRLVGKVLEAPSCA